MFLFPPDIRNYSVFDPQIQGNHIKTDEAVRPNFSINSDNGYEQRYTDAENLPFGDGLFHILTIGHCVRVILKYCRGSNGGIFNYVCTLLPNRFHRLYVHQTSINPGAFLRMIVVGLGESPKLGKDRLLMQITDKIQASEIDTMLIIDEAHLLAAQTLTDLRLLINDGLEKRLPLKIILCGQESLGEVLKRSAHADLIHRISVRVRLHSLSKSETSVYIEHR